MVYFNGIFSVLEALYLDDRLTDTLIDADIVVNPISNSYLSGKTIILNQPDLNIAIINKLQLNPSIELISRIPEYPNIKTVPYLEKIIYNIIWNGHIIKDLSELDDSGIEINWPKFYFPKIINPGQTLFEGYPSALGFLLYQVGQDNLVNSKLFDNLDIIKCKKGNLGAL